MQQRMALFQHEDHGPGCTCGADHEIGDVLAGGSPFSKLKPADRSGVKWTDGFWGDRYAQLRDVTLPYLYELMDDPERGHALTNLRIAAGQTTGEFAGTHWHDEWVYKWLEAASYVYESFRNPQLLVQMDEVIDIAAKAQQPDGYIATQTTVRGLERFQNINMHELYVMGHLISAACVHHRVTGKNNLLNVAIKAADYMYVTFHTRDPKLAHFCFNPSHIMGLVDLYRTTKEPRYLEIAIIFIENRGSVKGGTDQNQDRVPLREEQEVVGHSVLSTYLYSGAADAYMETGDESLLAALDRLWKDLTGKKMYVNGGIAALHKGLSLRPVNDGEFVRHKGRDLVHEAAGTEYELPNSTAYNETCAQIGNYMWNWRLLHIRPDARYADVMELSLYNSIISGIGLEGKSWFYTNVLRWYGADHRLLTQDAYQRFPPAKLHICCPSNLLRTMASIHGYLYSVSTEGVWVHHYGANEWQGELADGSPIEWVQETRYPWDGQVVITLKSAPREPFTVHLRIPEWAHGASVSVNGAQTEAAGGIQPGTYAAVTRSWQAGDVIELNLPMAVRLLEGNPKIETTRNQLAVFRGPVLYCLESVDLPEGFRVEDMILPRSSQLSARFDSDLLGGVTVLEGELLARRQEDWSGVLYREANTQPAVSVPVQLIPYYTWSNRGISEMTVWMPTM
jgi:DUF1680 family protein